MQQDNATQSGADSLQPAHSGRNAALAQIAKAVDQSYQEDLNPFDETSGQILPKAGQPEQQEQQATQETQAAAEEDGEQQEEQQEAQQSAPQAQDDIETIVVDGKQVQVKRSQLIDAGRRTLQKEEAAAKRLEEATATLRQAQAYAAQLRQQHQPSSDAGGFSQSPSSEDATNRSGAQTQAIPQQELGTLVRHELWLANAETAAQRFRSEFKDIAEDPLLMRLAGQLEDERLALAASTGAPLGDPWEAYKKHGETIRERFGKPQTAKPAASEDRLERKRSTTTVVGSGARAQPSQPKQPLSTSEIIEQQRLARQRGRQIQTTR